MDRFEGVVIPPSLCCGGTVTEFIIGVFEVAAAALISSSVGILSDVVITTFAGDNVDVGCDDTKPFMLVLGARTDTSCLGLNEMVGWLFSVTVAATIDLGTETGVCGRLKLGLFAAERGIFAPTCGKGC